MRAENDRRKMTNQDEVQPAALKQQGVDLMRRGRLEEACATLIKLCQRDPTDAEAWHLLSGVCRRQGRIAEAAQSGRRAIELCPDYSEAHVNMGLVCTRLGRREQALEHYQTALRLSPQHPGIYINMGCVQVDLGRYDDAAESFQAAIDRKPDFAEAYFNLGNLRRTLKQDDEAARNYKEAIRLKPDYVPAYNNLGGIYYEQGNIEAAAEHFRRAMALDPGWVETYNNLGNLLTKQNNLSEAARMYERALQLKHDFTDARISLAGVRNRQGRPEAAVELFKQALQQQPQRTDVQSDLLMTMHYVAGNTIADLSAAARQWASQYAPPQPCLPAPHNTANPGRRLRIGYVSADLHHHPVGFYLDPVLAQHDRSRFEVYCYYNAHRPDDQNSRLRALSDHWRDIVELSDEETARRIRQDGIDVLVDLSGHTAKSRLLVFAHKPAPVQATWLGYFNTTGLQAMDYIIADRFVIHPEEECHYVEHVVRLPGCYMIFTPPHHPIEVSPPPALTSGKITFGCFNNPTKLNEGVIDVWAKLLKALPDTQLYLKFTWFDDEGVRRRYRDLFAARGVAPERISFSGYSPREKLLEAYQEVDIALDPFPYPGGTTTVEALWMGVPVISLRGDKFVGRVGESILTTVGLGDFVAETQEAYIEKASAMASDLERLARLRGKLRQQLLDSPLCDGETFTQSLEALYRETWETWCRSRYNAD